jgi:hypothetical protein
VDNQRTIHLDKQELFKILSRCAWNIIRIHASSFHQINFDRSPVQLPEWIDIDKYRRGQKFVSENYYAIIMVLRPTWEGWSSATECYTAQAWIHRIKPCALNDRFPQRVNDRSRFYSVLSELSFGGSLFGLRWRFQLPGNLVWSLNVGREGNEGFLFF